MISSDPVMKKDSNYNFEGLSKLWIKSKDKKVDYLFKHDNGGMFYSKSYCDYFKGDVKKISESFLQKISYSKIIEQNDNDLNGIDARFSLLSSNVENHQIYIFHQALKSNECYYDITGIAHDISFKSNFLEAVKGIKL